MNHHESMPTAEVEQQQAGQFFEQNLDTVVTIFGHEAPLRDHLSDLQASDAAGNSLCPVKQEDWTPEGLDRFTAQTMHKSGYETAPEHLDLLKPKFREQAVKRTEEKHAQRAQEAAAKQQNDAQKQKEAADHIKLTPKKPEPKPEVARSPHIKEPKPVLEPTVIAEIINQAVNNRNNQPIEQLQLVTAPVVTQKPKQSRPKLMQRQQPVKKSAEASTPQKPSIVVKPNVMRRPKFVSEEVAVSSKKPEAVAPKNMTIAGANKPARQPTKVAEAKQKPPALREITKVVPVEQTPPRPVIKQETIKKVQESTRQTVKPKQPKPLQRRSAPVKLKKPAALRSEHVSQLAIHEADPIVSSVQPSEQIAVNLFPPIAASETAPIYSDITEHNPGAFKPVKTAESPKRSAPLPASVTIGERFSQSSELHLDEPTAQKAEVFIAALPTMVQDKLADFIETADPAELQEVEELTVMVAVMADRLHTLAMGEHRKMSEEQYINELEQIDTELIKQYEVLLRTLNVTYEPEMAEVFIRKVFSQDYAYQAVSVVQPRYLPGEMYAYDVDADQHGDPGTTPARLLRAAQHIVAHTYLLPG